MAEAHVEEHFDILTKTGRKTGITKPRGDVHKDGDYHGAVHVWIFSESTQELLLQRRADCKDSFPGLWDISSAGHISAGDSSLITARRELHEELGVILPKDAFELIFIYLQECVTNGGKFINNEFDDVYLVTTLAPIPLEAFTLQREYEEFKVRINALVAKAQKKPEEGWVMQDGTPWPGNNTHDHPGMIQVYLGKSGALDVEEKELPKLVYVSREKRPGYQHHKKAKAMNAMVRVSAVLTNAPFMLNLDCDHYINNSKVVREATCFLMDPHLGKKLCYVQFPQRFDGIDRHDRYANRNVVFFDESEVSAVKYISCDEYKRALATEDPEYVHYDINGKYGLLFDIIAQRYKDNIEERSLSLQKQLYRYASISLSAELEGLSDADMEALSLLVKAATIIDEIFYQQVWYSNPTVKYWLKQHADTSYLDKLKWQYYMINKSPWSSLDENEAFLTTADSAVILLPEATKPIVGWKGLEYKAAFPVLKPPGANFYPPDMDKTEFQLWKESLTDEEQQDVTGFFNVIKRRSEFILDSSLPNSKVGSSNFLESYRHELYSVPYSQEYRPFLTKAAELLHKAGDLTSSHSLKMLLHSKGDAFLSNDYYESDIAWMELDSKLDVTIGPYETYEDTLFGYKATFEAFIGVRDDKATAQVKLFGDHLQVLEENLPMENMYKSKDVIAAPIRVIQLVYNSGDVKGPQTVAFNLPNDERIVKDRGTSMVMLKNISEAKFEHILQPLANVCITEEQRTLVDFESFFTHTVCHECCHGIGPHTITLPSGQKSTVRLELQELHSALEEAKADIVGLWALKYLISQGLLPNTLLKSMYVSFLAGCFRSVRFGLEEAHGKGQALQFNWLFQNGAFVLHSDETFSVNFDKVEGVVESLSREILTIQAKGDKNAAGALLQKYSTMTHPLKVALEKLEKIQVPVDIAPTFPIADKILDKAP